MLGVLAALLCRAERAARLGDVDLHKHTPDDLSVTVQDVQFTQTIQATILERTTSGDVAYAHAVTERTDMNDSETSSQKHTTMSSDAQGIQFHAVPATYHVDLLGGTVGRDLKFPRI